MGNFQATLAFTLRRYNAIIFCMKRTKSVHAVFAFVAAFVAVSVHAERSGEGPVSVRLGQTPGGAADIRGRQGDASDGAFVCRGPKAALPFRKGETRIFRMAAPDGASGN